MKFKIHFLLVSVFTFLCFNFSFSQIKLTENFNYSAGDSIGSHGWVWAAGTTNTILVTSPGLTYTSYPFSGIGNATTLNNTGNDNYKDLSSPDSTGSLYAAFMVRVDSAKAQGDYFLSFLQNNSTTFFEGRVSARLRSGNLNFGITKANSTSDTSVAGIWTTASYSLGVTYLVILKYTFVPSGTTNDQVSLFVFTSGIPSTEPSPTLGPITYSSLDAVNIGRIVLRQGGGSTRAPYLVLDGIRVGTTWKSLTDSVEIKVLYALGSLPETFGCPDTLGIRLSKSVPGMFDVNLKIKTLTIDTPIVVVDSALIVVSNSGIYDTLINYKIPCQNAVSPILIRSLRLLVEALTGTRSPYIYDSKDYCQSTTYDSYNYADSCRSLDNGVGIDNNSGNIVAQFKNNSSNVYPINAVNHSFFNTGVNGNQPYKIVIYGDNGSGKPGSLLYASSTLTSPAGTAYLSHTLSSPVNIAANSKFYVGIRQTSTVNIGMSAQNEVPVRSKSFFYSFPDTSNTWTDFSTAGLNYRLYISPYSLSNVYVSPNNKSYPTLGAAFTAINTGTHGSGNIVVTITSNTTETSTATLNGGVFASCTIRPTANVTVTGNIANAIINLDGADNVTIDGRIKGTGTTKSLTIDNTSSSNSAGCIQMSNGASNNDIKYCICKGLGAGTTVGGRVINIAQSITAVGNNNNIIEFNTVIGGRRAIQTFGTASLVTNDGTIIRNNIVKNASSLAIFIGSETRNTTCDENDVFMDPGAVSVGAALNFRGINCQGVGTNNIRKNKVHDLQSTDITSTYIGILSIPVTLTAPGSNTTTANFINNCVTLMTNTDGFVEGIAISFIAQAYTANVYNNTIRLAGSTAAIVPNTTEALDIGNTVVPSVANVYNNIAINGKTGGDATTLHIGLDLLVYPSAGNTLNSDYNITKGIDATSWDAGYNGYLYRNEGIEQYKDSTCVVSIEQHTAFQSQSFTGLNSCVFAAGTVGGNMNGKTPLTPAVLDDINGTVRNTTYPYRGCYEGAALKVLTLTVGLEGKTADSQINIALLLACANKATSVGDLNIGTNITKVCYGDAINTATGYVLDVTSLNHLETWSSGTVTFTGIAGSYNFTSSQSQAFGSNQAATPVALFGGDVNQDGTIDVTDLGLIDNDGFNFAGGCRIRTDVNTDGTVDVTDASIADNNAFNFVSKISPCAPNSYESSDVENSQVKTFKNNLIEISGE